MYMYLFLFSIRKRWFQISNPFDYDVPPASQEELMVMVHPFKTRPSKSKKGKRK
jgi:hypothetical protein